MTKIDRDVELFLQQQDVILVSTVDPEGSINTAAKGIARIDAEKGIIYIVDLYNGKTRRNLSANGIITISAVDYDRFKGWQIKGSGIEHESDETAQIMSKWDQNLTSRIAKRIIHNMRKGRRSTLKHSEKTFPKPKYIIEMQAKEIINLSRGSGKINHA